MTQGVPRVALLTDSYHQVNGAARACRELENFARRRSIPFFSLHEGEETWLGTQGSVTTLQLKPSVAVLPVDQDHHFDPLLLRHRRLVRGALRQFRPDLVHIIAPGNCGILGALLSHELRIPLVASWHTNLHEYLAKRLGKLLRFLPPTWRQATEAATERISLKGAMRFYSIPRLLLAPNPELVELLKCATGRPAFLMRRGVDTALFSPARRRRGNPLGSEEEFVLGYVGRLAPEKNVHLLVTLERELLAAGERNFRLVIVGEGGDRAWLEGKLTKAAFMGVLRGEDLARAYADMDLFVFPSSTDAFGNVVHEALASGVPAVVTSSGGPKFLVQHGVTGFVATDEKDFIRRVLQLMRDRRLHSGMRQAACRHASRLSWDTVFEELFGIYRRFLASQAQPLS